MQLITAAKMTGAKTTSALGAVRGATEAKVKVAKEKEAKITKQRDDEDKQDAIDFIWSTQVGYKILKSSTNGSEKNIGSAAINELVRRNDTIFNGRDGLRRAIKNLDSHSASELRNIFENSITQHQISVTNIYRGMNGSKDFLAIAMNNADYQPQTFTAASASEDVAKTFAKGLRSVNSKIVATNSDPVILEISGKAKPIANPYSEDDEQELVFSRNASFSVTHIQGNRFRLKQR